jgi:hypothetical protein
MLSVDTWAPTAYMYDSHPWRYSNKLSTALLEVTSGQPGNMGLFSGGERGEEEVVVEEEEQEEEGFRWWPLSGQLAVTRA